GKIGGIVVLPRDHVVCRPGQIEWQWNGLEKSGSAQAIEQVGVHGKESVWRGRQLLSRREGCAADRDLQPALVAVVGRAAEIQLPAEGAAGDSNGQGITPRAVKRERRSDLVARGSGIEQLENHVEAAIGRAAAVS